MESWLGPLMRYEEGNPSIRIETPMDTPTLERVRIKLNQVLAEGELRQDEIHSMSMDLAMGLADCFGVLSEVRTGKYDMRVSPDTLNCKEELVGKLGTVINLTAQDLELKQVAQDDQAHLTAMDLAMGLADCFSVLTEVRMGNFNVGVSPDTLACQEELVGKLGGMINETVRDVQLMHDRQEATIRELSVPLLQIWEGVMLAPLVGVIDSKQAVDIMDKILKSILGWQARHVILDLTGVDIVDTKTADYLVKIARSAQLLGARCFLTGVQPAVAQTLVELGVDLSGLRTGRNLETGLRSCLKEMQQK
jgi:anti-anti-sigma factor